MNDHGKSDGPVVPEKPPNNAADAVADPTESKDKTALELLDNPDANRGAQLRRIKRNVSACRRAICLLERSV